MKIPINIRFPELVRPLTLPEGQTEQSVYDYLAAFQLDGAPSKELEAYLREDFRRFAHTLALLPTPEEPLEALEIGANPYFTSILLRRFTRYQLSFTNFFGKSGGVARQTHHNPATGESHSFEYLNHNIDATELPWPGRFSVVLFCEVLEHLINDPMAALLRVKRSLAEGGCLILTTPNVNRLENVARMFAGANVYDPYSGYGPYGRHNREYNKHELSLLLAHCGFEIEIMFSSDVHDNRSDDVFPVERLAMTLGTVPHRRLDLGQYLFVRARNVRAAQPGRPDWLYRSFPDAEMARGT